MEPREDTLYKKKLQQFSYSFIIVIRLTFKLSFEIVFVTGCEEQLFMLCFSTSVAEKSKRWKAVNFQGRTVGFLWKYLQIYQWYFRKKQHTPTSKTMKAAENNTPTSHDRRPVSCCLGCWRDGAGAED
jgi:hypothetical protein